MFLQFNFFNYYRIYSGVAQLVEQATVNRWVTGSSPVAGAIEMFNQFLGELMVKVSFVCPIFNKEKYLPNVLNALKNQKESVVYDLKSVLDINQVDARL